MKFLTLRRERHVKCLRRKTYEISDRVSCIVARTTRARRLQYKVGINSEEDGIIWCKLEKNEITRIIEEITLALNSLAT